MEQSMKRVETGPLKINDDWTGVFIRGDDALMLFRPALTKILIRKATGEGEDLNVFDIRAIEHLVDVLSACFEGTMNTQKINGEVE
jgi:hypothetical protein